MLHFLLKIFYAFIALLVLIILLNLGFWQLNRAAEKRAILQAYQRQQTLPPVTINDLQADVKTLQYRKIILTGQFDNAHTFLLDNRVVQQQRGYEVLTPFILADGKLLLVNRGWVAHDATHFPPIRGEQTIQGILILYPTKTFELNDGATDNTWPRVIQSLNFAKLNPQLNSKLLSLIVLLDPQAKFGFIREWKIINAEPSRHIAYAVQWFCLAAIWCIIIIIIFLRRKKLYAKRTQ